MGISIEGWQVSTSSCGEYLFVELDGAPGQIIIKADDEGFVVDIWDCSDDAQCVGSTRATYRELEPE